MRKTILFSDNTAKEMTFEETRKRFLPMLIKAMKVANNKFIYNAVEEDDFKQILEIELWRAYEQYDPSLGKCFTTYLYPKLRKGVRNATYYKYSMRNQGTVISINQPITGDDLKIEDLLFTDDNTMNHILFKELLDLINKHTTEDELEILRTILDKKAFPVQQLADKYGITRQAANQRIVKYRKKLQKVIASTYLDLSKD